MYRILLLGFIIVDRCLEKLAEDTVLTKQFELKMNEKLNKKLKIGIACHSFRLDGGMGRYVLLLTQGLLELGYTPVIISKKFDKSLPEYSKILPVHIDCRWLPTKIRDFYFNWRLGKYRKDNQLDLVISCNRNEHSDIMICGGTHKCFLEAMNRKPSFFDKLQIDLETKAYAASRMIVAHSKNIQTELNSSYAISNEKILQLYPPVSFKNFYPANQVERIKLREKFSFPKDKVVFVLPSAGNHYVKGLDLIAKYFSETDLPVLLAVAGRPIPTGYKNVIQMGFQKNMREVYQAADFTVLPSRYEAFGQVTIESLCCNTPVLLSKSVGSAEVIDDKAKIVFDWSKANSFDSALRSAVQKVRSSSPMIVDGSKLFQVSVDIKEHVFEILSSFDVYSKR